MKNVAASDAVRERKGYDSDKACPVATPRPATNCDDKISQSERMCSHCYKAWSLRVTPVAPVGDDDDSHVEWYAWDSLKGEWEAGVSPDDDEVPQARIDAGATPTAGQFSYVRQEWIDCEGAPFGKCSNCDVEVTQYENMCHSCFCAWNLGKVPDGWSFQDEDDPEDDLEDDPEDDPEDDHSSDEFDPEDYYYVGLLENRHRILEKRNRIEGG